jgi:pseudomonalisin
MPVRRTLRPTRRPIFASSSFAASSFAVSSALLAALIFATPAASLHAQATSQAISAIKPIAQADRIPAHANFAPLTQLSHQLPGWVQGRPQSSARSVDLGTTLHVSLVLNRDPAVEAAFTQLLADQQTPGSPLYHQWLTPQQIGTLYGPTANDLAALTSWLTSQGLKIDSIAPSGVILHASGSAAVLGNAFHTTFAIFDPTGPTSEGLTAAPRLSAVSEPSIPSALTPLVRSIQGLGELEIKPLNQANAVKGTLPPTGSTSSAGVHPLLTLNDGSHYVTPGDFALIFDINTVYNGGNKGAAIGSKAQRVAIIGESRVTDTDITEYEANTGLPSTVPTVVVPPGDTDPGTTATNLQSEATLDVDRVIGTAPGVAMDLVIAKQLQTSGGIFDAAEYNVNTLLDPVMTISFGGCEISNGLSNTDYVDTLAQTAAGEGITILVSSGDSGAAGCDSSFVAAPATQTASINFICSSTYVTCVGGTEFNDTANSSLYWSSTNTSTYVSALSYIPEGGWNEPGPNSATPTYAPASSGGGVSLYIAKPTWQDVTGVPSGSFRFVPDVSFPASGHDGYYACLAGYGGGDCSKGYFEYFSGTSAAAPGMAGVVALINTKTGSSAGNINPMLYKLYASTPSAFHDTTIATSGVSGCSAATPSMCNNSTPATSTLTGGLSGFLLTTGYDEVTGLGSMDVANLVAASTVSSGGGTSGSFTLTPLAATLTTTSGAATAPATEIQIASVAGFSGTVNLTCTVKYAGTGSNLDLPTCSFEQNSEAITPSAGANDILAAFTTAPTTTTCPAASASPKIASTTAPWLGGSMGIAFAALLLFLPLRKRRAIRALAMAFLLVTGFSFVTGCGSSSTSGGSTCTPVVTPGTGTTAGSYTITVTGVSGSTTETTTVALTVN